MAKGREDSLYISCVASSNNLWAVVMDGGTGFTSQVYELSHNFLHKVGIAQNSWPTLSSFTTLIMLRKGIVFYSF